MTITRGDWMGTAPVDMLGRPFQPGQKVVKSFTSGRATNLEIRTVHKVDGGKVFLDSDYSGPRAVIYPSRLLILEGPYEG